MWAIDSEELDALYNDGIGRLRICRLCHTSWHYSVVIFIIIYLTRIQLDVRLYKSFWELLPIQAKFIYGGTVLNNGTKKLRIKICTYNKNETNNKLTWMTKRHTSTSSSIEPISMKLPETKLKNIVMIYLHQQLLKNQKKNCFYCNCNI